MFKNIKKFVKNLLIDEPFIVHILTILDANPHGATHRDLTLKFVKPPSFSKLQVYLNRLVDKGLVRVNRATHLSVPVYVITPAGEQSLSVRSSNSIIDLSELSTQVLLAVLTERQYQRMKETDKLKMEVIIVDGRVVKSRDKHYLDLVLAAATAIENHKNP